MELQTIIIVGLFGWLAYKVNLFYLRVARKAALPVAKGIISAAVKGHPF